MHLNVTGSYTLCAVARGSTSHVEPHNLCVRICLFFTVHSLRLRRRPFPGRCGPRPGGRRIFPEQRFHRSPQRGASPAPNPLGESMTSASPIRTDAGPTLPAIANRLPLLSLRRARPSRARGAPKSVSTRIPRGGRDLPSIPWRTGGAIVIRRPNRGICGAHSARHLHPLHSRRLMARRHDWPAATMAGTMTAGGREEKTESILNGAALCDVTLSPQPDMYGR